MRAVATIVACLGATACAAAAGDLWIEGAWCAENGERMFVTAEAMGFNEHTVCDWDRPPTDQTEYSARLACKNIYLNGEEIVEAFHRNVALTVRRLSEEDLEVAVDAGPARVFSRCEG